VIDLEHEQGQQEARRAIGDARGAAAQARAQSSSLGGALEDLISSLGKAASSLDEASGRLGDLAAEVERIDDASEHLADVAAEVRVSVLNVAIELGRGGGPGGAGLLAMVDETQRRAERAELLASRVAESAGAAKERRVVLESILEAARKDHEDRIAQARALEEHVLATDRAIGTSLRALEVLSGPEVEDEEVKRVAEVWELGAALEAMLESGRSSSSAPGNPLDASLSRIASLIEDFRNR